MTTSTPDPTSAAVAPGSVLTVTGADCSPNALVQVVIEAPDHATAQLASVRAGANGRYTITVEIPELGSPTADLSAGCVSTGTGNWSQHDLIIRYDPSAPAPKLLACPQYMFHPQSSDAAANILTNRDCTLAEQIVAAAPQRPSPPTAYMASGYTCSAGPEMQPPGGGKSHFPFRCQNAAGGLITFDRY